MVQMVKITFLKHYKKNIIEKITELYGADGIFTVGSSSASGWPVPSQVDICDPEQKQLHCMLCEEMPLL